VRRDSTNYFDRPHAMRDRNHFLLVNPSGPRPDSPVAVYGTGGVDEDAVEIEEYGRAEKSGHAFF
jgi:hypothetical protein